MPLLLTVCTLLILAFPVPSWADIAGEPLTQADKDWLRLQCDSQHTLADCASADNEITEQGKTITTDDISYIFSRPPTVSQQVNGISLEQAVDACVGTIRKEVESDFDGYTKGSTVNTFGSPRARFKFQKCMYKHGHQID
jgi:hypothetical protein